MLAIGDETANREDKAEDGGNDLHWAHNVECDISD